MTRPQDGFAPAGTESVVQFQGGKRPAARASTTTDDAAGLRFPRKCDRRFRDSRKAPATRRMASRSSRWRKATWVRFPMCPPAVDMTATLMEKAISLSQHLPRRFGRAQNTLDQQPAISPPPRIPPDGESRIRDMVMQEEMMDHTENNILTWLPRRC